MILESILFVKCSPLGVILRHVENEVFQPSVVPMIGVRILDADPTDVRVAAQVDREQVSDVRSGGRVVPVAEPFLLFVGHVATILIRQHVLGSEFEERFIGRRRDDFPLVGITKFAGPEKKVGPINRNLYYCYTVTPL